MAKNIDETLVKIETKIDDVSDMVHKIDKEVALQKATFEDHTKQDEKMYEELKRMNDILSINTESLKEHMQRTEINEKQLILMEELISKIDSRLSPIEQERIEAEAIRKYRNETLIKLGKILGAAATIVAIVAGLKSI